MSVHIPKWIFAAFVGAAPMLGIVFLILFSCTLLGLVQRCKISLAKSYANRQQQKARLSCMSMRRQQIASSPELHANLDNLTVSPFETISMKHIDTQSSSKIHEETRASLSTLSYPRLKRSIDNSITESDYDNGSLSIFNDNDFEHDRISLIDIASSRKTSKQAASPDTIIHV